MAREFGYDQQQRQQRKPSAARAGEQPKQDDVPTRVLSRGAPEQCEQFEDYEAHTHEEQPMQREARVRVDVPALSGPNPRSPASQPPSSSAAAPRGVQAQLSVALHATVAELANAYACARHARGAA